jgi:hypothetical protein
MTDREPLCGEPKDGGYRLHCELPAAHEGWHRGVWHHRQEVTYLGSHHVIETTETVTWEPVNRVAEAVNRIMSGHDANPVNTEGTRAST